MADPSELAHQSQREEDVAMSHVEIVRELPPTPTGAEQVLVKAGEGYYVVSSVHAPLTGFETLVFPADEHGNVTDWLELFGGRGVSREEAIAEIEEDWLNAE